MNEPIDEPIEQEVRKLRDLIYGKQTDAEWSLIKKHWIDDVDWLRAEVKKLSKS